MWIQCCPESHWWLKSDSVSKCCMHLFRDPLKWKECHQQGQYIKGNSMGGSAPQSLHPRAMKGHILIKSTPVSSGLHSKPWKWDAMSHIMSKFNFFSRFLFKSCLPFNYSLELDTHLWKIFKWNIVAVGFVLPPPAGGVCKLQVLVKIYLFEVHLRSLDSNIHPSCYEPSKPALGEAQSNTQQGVCHCRAAANWDHGWAKPKPLCPPKKCREGTGPASSRKLALWKKKNHSSILDKSAGPLHALPL